MFQVRLLALAAACLLHVCAASLCVPGLQFWSNESESCINCSRCNSGAKHVVIRPCQAHTDTVCGPISDLDIDWSWLKHGAGSEKKHHKKGHKHHTNLESDIERKPFHHTVSDDDVETITFSHHNHGGHKHHKVIDEDGLEIEKKSKAHHTASDNVLSDDFDYKKHHKMPPPPPLRSTDDLEKEWKEWLIQSKNRLQHRKDDLLKNLHKESPYNNKHSSHRLNHPSGIVFDDFDGEIFHHSSHHKDHLGKMKHFSPLDLETFDRLLNHEQQKHERMSLSHLLSKESKHGDLLDILKTDEKRKGDDLSYPMDTLDFRSVVPTHRLFLGEPSTVSEMLDQDISEETEDEKTQDSDSGVVAIPFTAAERLVWDWQAVALASAVTACMLFFAVVGVYSVLHARQWRRLKTNFDTGEHKKYQCFFFKITL